MRITRVQAFMKMAHVAAERSTCFRLNVGAIITNHEHNIIASGYNGPPSGEPHCFGNTCVPPGVQGCVRAVHAERNAIDRAGVAWRRDRILYVTHSPCPACAEAIINEECGIGMVYYGVEYRKTEPIQRLTEAGIRCYRVSPSGYVINPLTNEIIDG